MDLLDILRQPWHWSISGVGIVLVMFLLLYFGGKFGVSSNLRTMCTICGAGRHADFFQFDWRSQRWNLVFIGGAVIGGYIASTFLASPDPVAISEATSTYLNSVGIRVPKTLAEGAGYVPSELFGSQHAFDLKNIIILIGGGLLIGFGTRYAGG